MLGIFDSGIGGLTVAQAIRTQAPTVDLVYFGDVANMPYGNRSLEELEILTLRAMKFLRAQGATHLVSACNSISTTVIRSLIELLGAKDTSITEMVNPTVQALMPDRDRVISVVATEATVQAGMYARDFEARGMSVNMFALPELASLIESGATMNECREVIATAAASLRAKQTDILVLGCTHYPFVEQLFHEALAQNHKPIRIFNPAAAVASSALMHHGIQGSGRTLIFTSEKTRTFEARVKSTFGPNVEVLIAPQTSSSNTQQNTRWTTPSPLPV